MFSISNHMINSIVETQSNEMNFIVLLSSIIGSRTIQIFLKFVDD